MTAQEIAQLFQRILEMPRVGLDGDFFLLGGDSLLATRVISAIAKTTGKELGLADVLTAPTPNALARQLDQVTK